MPDVLVIGCGPAALLLASALRDHGVDFLVVGPPDPWPAVYGAWVDELRDVGLHDAIAEQWAGVDVYTPAQVSWERAYARLDNARLRARLAVDVFEDLVDAVHHEVDGSVVKLRSGRQLWARRVVDASGYASAFVARLEAPPPLVQAAVGWRIRGRHAYPLDRARWMDLRPVGEGDPPTFAYVLPTSATEVFVEETSLARTPAVAFDVLEARLRARLERDGVAVDEVVGRERCWLPMTGPLPVLGQQSLAFGAAAGLVHPASGYQLVTAARRAPGFAGAIAHGLAFPPSVAARLAWDALWPPDAVRTRELYAFGARFAAELDPASLQRFMAAFYTLPAPVRAAWLADRLSPGELARAMAGVFGAADASTRWRLVRAATSEPAVLFRSLTGL